MSVVVTTEFGQLRRVQRDFTPVALLKCPVCGVWGELDDEMFHGRVSVDHTEQPGCTYHETHDFAAAADAAGGWRIE